MTIRICWHVQGNCQEFVTEPFQSTDTRSIQHRVSKYLKFLVEKINGKDIIIEILTKGTVLLLASNVGRNIGQVWLPLSVTPHIQ